MPNVVVGAGETVEEVKRTRILKNGSDPAADQDNPKDALEYMEALTPEAWTKGEHTVYLYRMEPPIFKGAGAAYVTKYATPINLEHIQREYGGGIWRIVIKRGDSRVSDRQYTISGIPKDLSQVMNSANGTAGAAAGYNGNAATPTDSNTARLIDAATDTEARKAQIEMVKSTADQVIQMTRDAAPKQMSVQDIIALAKEMQPKMAAASPDWWSNPLVIAIVTKLVDRLFANPFEQLPAIIDMVSKMNGGANVVGDWKLAAAQAVPKVAESLADALHEMRMGAEVQAGYRTPQSETVIRAGQAAGAQTQPVPPAGQPSSGQAEKGKVIEMQAPQGDPMEAFETKFVELLANPQVSGAQAAEILWHDWANILTEIANYSPEIIMANAFKRPILAPHAANPRNPQFLGEMIAWVKAQQQNPKGA